MVSPVPCYPTCMTNLRSGLYTPMELLPEMVTFATVSQLQYPAHVTQNHFLMYLSWAWLGTFLIAYLVHLYKVSTWGLFELAV